MLENKPKHVYATLVLTGKGLHPNEVTESLGLKPSMSFKRGDRRNETDIWKHNFWSLTTQESVHSNNLAVHLEWLVDQLEPVKSELITIINDGNVKSEISCFWILPTDHETLLLSSDLLRRIAQLGLNVNMDVYSP